MDNSPDKPRQKPKITIIFNPVAGNRRETLLHDVVAALDNLGWQVSIVGTTAPGNATQVAREAAAEGVDAIVAAGGDGTINEVVSGLVDSSVPIGIIPMGTANVLAKELRIPDAASGIAEIISTGATRRLHLGRVNGRRFLLMVGAGFDGEVVHAVAPDMKRRWGKYAFVMEGLRAIAANPARPITIEADGKQLRAAWAVVTNISRYGGPYVLMPDADPGAPMLTGILFERASRLSMCANLLRIGLGGATRARSVRVVHASSFWISSDCETSIPVQADGDAAGILPTRIDATDQFVNVLAPAAAR